MANTFSFFLSLLTSNYTVTLFFSPIFFPPQDIHKRLSEDQHREVQVKSYLSQSLIGFPILHFYLLKKNKYYISGNKLLCPPHIIYFPAPMAVSFQTQVNPFFSDVKKHKKN